MAVFLAILTTAGMESPTAKAEAAETFQSTESFFSALNNVTWETSFPRYPRVRFLPDRIEVLAMDNRVMNRFTGVTHLEPGVIKLEQPGGELVLFQFADDLNSFVVANMLDITEFDVLGAAGPVKLPALPSDPPLDIKLKEHFFWNQIRLHSDKMEVLDAGGSASATNEGYAFYPHGLGMDLPEKRAGLAVLSRKRAGGWYLSGRHLGTGTRTNFVGVFRSSPSKMRDFSHRSVHFTRALLRAGQVPLVAVQERYAVKYASMTYGENSEAIVHAYNELGKIHGNERSYDRAAEWHARAYAAAKANFGSDSAKVLELGTDLAESQGETGDFAAAKVTLEELLPLLPPPGGHVRVPYAYYRALGAAEFGLRNYPQAVQIFRGNVNLSLEARSDAHAVEALLDLAACQMALNQPIEAAASLNLAMSKQEERKQRSPKTTFDTYKLSLACTAMQKWEEAIKYSDETQRRSSVTYMECARLLALLNKGDKVGAQKLAQDFSRRYKGGLDEVEIRRDIDAMILKVTSATAALTPQATSELEQTWAEQVESLRKRPLQNYLFARVMVAAIASLKNGP
jgi:tetratricopeptide (TPR) repeat protein